MEWHANTTLDFYFSSHDDIVSYFNSSKFWGATFVPVAKSLISKSDVYLVANKKE